MPAGLWQGTAAAEQEAAVGFWRAAGEELPWDACSGPSSALAGCGTGGQLEEQRIEQWKRYMDQDALELVPEQQCFKLMGAEWK